ncbi:hypothetical protein [Leptolyngbya sp. NIES-2104]|uniref:hypothetical protein n=1 Tax=Leptolyngbya sp. NIES-2104 TaxID=1552121 RepID=UPI0006EC605F|nr:hypothetical protein [Leptolyngbya sp. NIES-2104]GAQ00164.1 hypothetical protein NIES2104_67290 [Leptolyngbya sp. NIES-2104]
MLEKIKQLPTEYDRLPRHEKIRLWVNTLTNAAGVILLAIVIFHTVPMLLRFQVNQPDRNAPTDHSPDPTVYR